MSKATHTPGPWDYLLHDDDPHGGGEFMALISGAGQEWIASVQHFYAGASEMNEANARLISAAPELLEALLESRSIGDRLARGVAVSKDEIRAANARQAAAIQKATGGQS